MKKQLVRILILSASLSLLVLAIPQTSAVAHHGKGHHPGGHCRNNPHDHDFKSETQDMSKQEKKQYKREHRHHKHQCNKYPPGQNRPNTSGQSAAFPAQSTPSGGLTVGVAALIAMGGLGALLLARRRWVFSTRR